MGLTRSRVINVYAIEEIDEDRIQSLAQHNKENAEEHREVNQCITQNKVNKKILIMYMYLNPIRSKAKE